MGRTYDNIKPWLTFSILVLLAVIAKAQFSNPGNGVTLDQMNSALASYATNSALTTVQNTIPSALGSIPLGPSGSGGAGSAGTYVPGNATQPQTVQRTTVTTDASGNWSVVFSPGFQSATPVINAIPLNNSTTVPIVCNTATRSQTTQTGHCWQVASQTVALISLTISLAPSNAPVSTPVMIVGAEPTQ